MCVWEGGGMVGIISVVVQGQGGSGLERDVFSCSQVDGAITERNFARYEYINFIYWN